jgi:hypothetical protein
VRHSDEHTTDIERMSACLGLKGLALQNLDQLGQVAGSGSANHRRVVSAKQIEVSAANPDYTSDPLTPQRKGNNATHCLSSARVAGGARGYTQANRPAAEMRHENHSDEDKRFNIATKCSIRCSGAICDAIATRDSTACTASAQSRS